MGIVCSRVGDTVHAAYKLSWQGSDPNAGTCTSCHPGHSTDGTQLSGFQVAQTTREVCDACHQVLRREDGGRG